MVVDRFSRLSDVRKEELPLDDSFPNDKLFALIQKETPYAEFFNYLTVRVLPIDMNYQRKKKCFQTLSNTTWMILYSLREVVMKYSRCVAPEEEFESVMTH